MRKDYAKKMTAKRHKRQHELPRLSLLLAIFVSTFVISMAGYWVVHNSLKGNFNTWIASAKSILGHKTVAAKTLAANKPAQDDDGVRFDFYTELPKMQVDVPETTELQSSPPLVTHTLTAAHKPVPNLPRPTALTQLDNSIQSAIDQTEKKATTTTTTTTTAKQYVIQVGIFRDQIGASQLRLSLLLAGIEANIAKLPDGTYRVQQGPYKSSAQAKAIQKRLTKKGFDSEIKSVT